MELVLCGLDIEKLVSFCMESQWQIKVLMQHFSSTRGAFAPPLVLYYVNCETSDNE